MRVIGVDIGTTTISLVVLDTDSGEVFECVNTPNTAARPGAQPFERVQDPETIVQRAKLMKRHIYTLRVQVRNLKCLFGIMLRLRSANQ